MADSNTASNLPPCDACASRPGVVRVMFGDQGRRSGGTLCEHCAGRLMGSAGAGPLGVQAGGLRALGPTAGPTRGRPAQGEPQSATPALDEFGRDLTADAAAGRIDPVIGRAAEIEQTVEILARRRKSNPVLIGEAGVGKTAIAEGLALRIHRNEVPETLEGVRIVALDLSGMIAGAQFRGQFEKRLKAALDEAVESEGKIVLFIDELHTVLGAG